MSVITQQEDRINTYLKMEKPFFMLNLVYPFLFVFVQLFEFFIILLNRPIIPPEIRGLIVIIFMIILCITNLSLYYTLYKSLRSDNKLTLKMYSIVQYRTRVRYLLFLSLLATLVYYVSYFHGFILNRIQPPPENPSILPSFAPLVEILIFVTFGLQLMYLVYNLYHVDKWRKMDQKLKQLEENIFQDIQM
ncbi:MAG: hypothetical protein INQ03_19970 [Candidatus Heimdallarchaeota archaeon]|nr:hypothetical protein [Candidatus Heimdallarchaeota archaeon]